jgi:hypothetical protein
MPLTTVNPALLDTQAQYTGFKNRLINPGMVIDQRNAGASVTPTNDGAYTLDRWSVSLSAASKFSVQQSSTAPTGFINSTLITSLSAFSVPSSGYFMFNQTIEGLNVPDLAWGTASAATVTLSFWVRSSLTGTFGGAIQNSAQNRAYPFSYTISSANTFEYKTVTIPGDTTGTWLTTNGVGMFVRFGLGVGSTFSATAGAWAAGQFFAPTGAVSVVGTNGATFIVTGVQLEKGSTATSFDYRPYGTELQLCQRYYQLCRSGVGGGNSSTAVVLTLPMRVDMRAAPSAFGLTGTVTVADGANDIAQSSASITGLGGTVDAAVALLSNFSGLTASRVYFMRLSTASAVTLSAEL